MSFRIQVSADRIGADVLWWRRRLELVEVAVEVTAVTAEEEVSPTEQRFVCDDASTVVTLRRADDVRRPPATDSTLALDTVGAAFTPATGMLLEVFIFDCHGYLTCDGYDGAVDPTPSFFRGMLR